MVLTGKSVSGRVAARVWFVNLSELRPKSERMYQGRKDFRSGRVMLVVTVVSTMIFAAVATVLFRTRGWGWLTIAMVLSVVIGFVGIIETFVVRIQLTDDALIVTDLRGTRRYEKAAIERIEELKGVPAVILLKDGKWAKLPSVEVSLGNSVRAWLKG